MNNYKSIFGNIIITYGQLILSSVFLLLSTRYQLINLGESDFGLFNLILGFITALSFLNLALSVSSQRYLSFYMGKDKLKLNNVFNNSFFLHLILGIILSIILFIIKTYLFNNFFKLQTDQIDIGEKIYLILILNIFFTIIAVPYNGTLLSLNKIKVFSFFSILEAFFKLASAFFLFYVEDDKLLINSLLLTGSYVFVFILRVIYCNQFNFTKISIKFLDKFLLKEMFYFSLWNMFGAIANISKNQGLNVLLNLFFGTLINASYAIANQLNNLFLFISSSITRSVSPLITREEGGSNRENMIELTLFQCKISYILMLILLFPIICDLDYFLILWLKEYPEYTLIFCRLIFVIALIGSLTTGLQSAIQSVGKIKAYQFTIGSLIFLNIPIGYVVLKLGFPPYYIFIITILIELLSIIVRVKFAKKLVGINEILFYKKILLPFFITIVICSIWFYYYTEFISINTYIGLIMNFMIVTIIIVLISIKDPELISIRNKIKAKFISR